MRFYLTLLFLLGAASAAQKKLLRSPGMLDSVGITQIVASKSVKARKLANLLRSIKNNRDLEATPELYEDGDGGFDLGDLDLGDLDLGDLDLGGIGLCDGEGMELGNVECTCSLNTMTGTPLTDIGTIMEEFSNIMENGIDMEFTCNTKEPECYQNECGILDVSCNMTMDFDDMMSSSLDCDTCVQYTDPPEGTEGTNMAGNKLCMDMMLCAPDLLAEKSASDGVGFVTDFDMSDILCECSATIENKDGKKICDCGICGDMSQGVELSCPVPGNTASKMESACASTGFEMLDANDASSMASATQFLPQFETIDDSDSTSSANSPPAAAPFFISALALVFVSSFA